MDAFNVLCEYCRSVVEKVYKATYGHSYFEPEIFYKVYVPSENMFVHKRSYRWSLSKKGSIWKQKNHITCSLNEFVLKEVLKKHPDATVLQFELKCIEKPVKLSEWGK